VRKFKKSWMEKNGVEIMDTSQHHNENTADTAGHLYVSGLEMLANDFSIGHQSTTTSTTILVNPSHDQGDDVPLPLTGELLRPHWVA
jgi:hypothetical protein